MRNGVMPLLYHVYATLMIEYISRMQGVLALWGSKTIFLYAPTHKKWFTTFTKLLTIETNGAMYLFLEPRSAKSPNMHPTYIVQFHLKQL